MTLFSDLLSISPVSPLVLTPQPRVSAYPDDETTLSCTVDAHPPPIAYWTRADGRQQLLTNTSKYELQLLRHPTLAYKSEMRLLIRRLQSSDFTGYSCVAHNSLGQSSGSIVLNALRRPLTSTTTTVSPPPPPPRRRRPPSPASTTSTSTTDRSFPVDSNQFIPGRSNAGRESHSNHNQPNLFDTQSSNWWLQAQQSTPSPEDSGDDSDEPWLVTDANGGYLASSSLFASNLMITSVLVLKSFIDFQFRIR